MGADAAPAHPYGGVRGFVDKADVTPVCKLANIGEDWTLLAPPRNPEPPARRH